MDEAPRLEIDGKPLLLSVAARAYREIRGVQKSKTFHASVDRTVGYLVEERGDKPVTAYTRMDANAFRDVLIGRGLAGSSVARNLGTIRAILNFTFNEHAISADNPFEKIQFNRDIGTQVRATIPPHQVKRVQKLCLDYDDEARWLIALISDTGLRLAEAVGLPSPTLSSQAVTKTTGPPALSTSSRGQQCERYPVLEIGCLACDHGIIVAHWAFSLGRQSLRPSCHQGVFWGRHGPSPWRVFCWAYHPSNHCSRYRMCCFPMLT